MNCRLHVWREFLRDAWAFYSKRDDGETNDLFWITGDVDHCAFCEEMQIRPYAKGLSAVRVVLVESIPMVKKEAA